MAHRNGQENSWPLRLNKEEEERLFNFLNQRFGISYEILLSFLWFKKGEHIYVIKNSSYVERMSGYKVLNVGIRILAIRKDFFIPHRWFLSALGRYALKSRITVSLDQLEELKRAPIEFAVDISNGPVVLAVSGIGDVGMGYYKNGQLRAQGLWI